MLEGVGTEGLARAGRCCCCFVCRGHSWLGQRDRASECPSSPSSDMAENSDKVPITLVGPDDIEFCSPPVSSPWVPSPGVE